MFDLRVGAVTYDPQGNSHGQRMQVMGNYYPKRWLDLWARGTLKVGWTHWGMKGTYDS